MTALLSVYYHDNIRDFLICSSREEDLRFDLMNFWVKEVRKSFTERYIYSKSLQGYKENLTTLPWFHPFEIFVKTLSTLMNIFYFWVEGFQYILSSKISFQHSYFENSSVDSHRFRQKHQSWSQIALKLFFYRYIIIHV